MKKESVRQKLFFAVIFVVAATIGFFVVKFAKHSASEPQISAPPIIIPDRDTTSIDTSIVIIPDTLIPDPGPKPKPVRKLSKGELTRIINDLNNQNYPRKVTLKYNNLDTAGGEEYQGSISNVRNYIISNVWSSVTVTDVTYDETTGRVKSITMTINRNTEE